MARLVLHTGAHKTGTTSLQRAFALNRDLLARHGVIYPDIGPNTGHHVLAGPWMRVEGVPGEFWPAGGPDVLWERLIAAHAAGDKTVFLSAENFSRALPERVDMVELAARLAAFESVEVIYVTRAQLGYLESIWLQVSKALQPPPFGRFYARAKDEHLASGLWLDHNDVYDHLLTGFAPDRIRVFDFEAVKAHPGGILGFFLDHLGLPLDVDDLVPVPVPGGMANPSPDPLAALAAARVAAPGAAPAGLVQMAGAALEAGFGAGTRTTLYTEAEAAKLVAHFAPLNARLEERLRPYQPGFRLTEPGPDPARPGRDRLTPAVWAGLARRIYRARARD